MSAAARQVAEDDARERGTWSPGALMWRLGLVSQGANATADADAYANATADADAYANANANANATADANAYANATADANAYATATANATADANAYATADANADANATAYAYANAENSFNPSSGGEHVRNGLFLFTSPSGNLTVVRVGWIRRVSGDEYECHSMVTPQRQGDYHTMWADAAIDGPPKKWTFTRPLPRSSPLNRFHILGPVSLDPKQWEKISPRPAGWEE